MRRVWLLTSICSTVTIACLFSTPNICSITGRFNLTHQEHIQHLDRPCCQAKSQSTCDYLSTLREALGRGQDQTLLGRGSMGTVHQIRHPESGETFAIKMFEPAANEKPAHFASAIQREFDFASRLNELPGFAKSYALLTSIHQDDTEHAVPQEVARIYLVMEYVPFSLGDLMNHDVQHDWSWTDADIRCVFSQTLSSVRSLHKIANLAHRDIKPYNLMLTHDGQIRLIDFGEAISIDAQTGLATSFTGTAPFLAPELYAPGRAEIGYDAEAADLWGLGMLLLRMYLDDEPWFASDAATDVDFQGFIEDPESYLRQYHFPEDIQRALVTLLSLDPKRRYQIDDIWDHDAVIDARCVQDGIDGQLRLVIDYD